MNIKLPSKLLTNLTQDEIYQQWQEVHPESYLSHFFCQLDNNFQLNTDWELGFFSNDKITVFVAHQNGFEIKPADDIFKKEQAVVEKLNLDLVTVNFEQALAVFKENLPVHFPKEIINSGFVILQTYQKQTVWNFTFITKTLKFINLKINSESGEIVSHDTVNLVQQGTPFQQN